MLYIEKVPSLYFYLILKGEILPKPMIVKNLQNGE